VQFKFNGVNFDVSSVNSLRELTPKNSVAELHKIFQALAERYASNSHDATAA
jgi:hypothetical protein